MAQTKRRRQTKHRGNAAGIVEARGRTGRAADAPREKGGKAARTARRSRARTARRSGAAAFMRASIATIVLMVVAVLFLHTARRS